MIPTKQPICIYIYIQTILIIQWKVSIRVFFVAHHGPAGFVYPTELSCGVFFRQEFFSAPIPHWWIVWGAFLGLPVGWWSLWFFKPMRVAWIRDPCIFPECATHRNEHMCTPSWSTPVDDPWMGFLSETLLEPPKAPEAILRKISISLRRGLQSCRHPKPRCNRTFRIFRGAPKF